MKTQAVLNCQIQKWYPTFRKVTFKTKLHKLSQEFVDYLREDGIVLHKDYNLNSDSESSDSSFSDDKKPEENEEKKVSDREEDQEISDKRKFTDLEKAIVDAVEDYDYFFVKLNWSSPKVRTYYDILKE